MTIDSRERCRGFTLALAVGLSGLSGGCGERESQPPVLGGYQRIELSAVDATGPVPEAQVLAKFEPGLEQHLWTARKGQATFSAGSAESLGSAPLSLGLGDEDPGDLIAVRAGDLELTGASEVQVWIDSPRPCRFVVALAHEGEFKATTDFADVLASKHPQLVVARFSRPFVGAFDSVEVRFLTARSSVALREVSILARPPSAKVAEQRAQELLRAGGEARRGWLVSPHRAVAAEARAGAHSSLVFSYAQTPEMRTGRPGHLRVDATHSDGRSTSQRLPLDAITGEPQWRAGKVDLALEKETELSIRFSLEIGQGLDAACAVADVAVESPPARRPPSVLLVTSDTHRGDFIGTAARPADVLTPNLDRLAARGVTFQDCLASTNVTNPSHIALMTGESPRDTGVHDNRTQLADAAPTLAESFRDLGYRTWAALSSRHLRHEVSGLGQGFDRVAAPFPTETRRAQETLAAVDAWLAEADASPVFLWVHLFDAHAPYEPPAEHAELYWPPGKDPMDPSLPDPGLPEDLLAPAELQGLRDLDYPIAQYKGEVSYLDAQLGGLLERRPFVDGVVAFVADHGESLGEHRIFYGHSGLYPQTIHVPLILSWPDGPRGERQMDPVQQIDVSRTLLDLVGAAALPFPGRSLLESVDRGDGKSAARFALSAHGLEASVTLDGHHLLLELRNHQELSDLDRSEKHAFRLYDLVQDPECRVDVAEAEPGLAKSLHGILVEWLQSPKDLGWAGETSEDPELLAALEELGYAAGPEIPAAEALWVADDCEWCQKLR